MDWGALEGQIQRTRSKHREHGERAPAWPVDGGERGVLAGLQDDVNRPPEQRIVRAETMRTWRDLSCGGLSVVQDRQTLAVHIDIDLAKPDVVGRGSRDDDGGSLHAGWSVWDPGDAFHIAWDAAPVVRCRCIVVDSAQRSERPKLSNELSEYLISLSVALQRHAMYPDGHPSLGPAVDAVMRRAHRLLEDRPSLAFGVARRQLIVEGVTTDPEHPVLRRLAEELHRHHLGAVSVSRGVQAAELSEALRVLASEPERGGASGLTLVRCRNGTHVKLHPLTFHGLAIVGDAPMGGGSSKQGTLSAELWVGLARAAISADAATAPEEVSLEPSAVAQSIDERQGVEAYDQVIVGYITQIARELRTSSGAETEALRRRASRLVKDLRPETLRRILEMGGDIGQRAAFVLDSAQGMTAEAALDVVKAAAAAGGQTISHSLLRMLSKLAAHTDEASTTMAQPMAGEGLREQVGRLLSDWTLEDPNPESHRQLLQQFAIAARGAGRAAGGRIARGP